MAREAAIQVYGAALDELAVAIAAFEIVPGGDWRMEAYTVDAPEPEAVRAALAQGAAEAGLAMPDFHIAPLPPVDWLAENRRGFPPQGLGRFFIHGSHFEGRVPPGRIGMLLDAATAFGSGEHDTTRGCLQSIEELGKRRPPRRALDVGCGSAILAIGMAKLWRRPVLATDIDAESVRVARENARLNRVQTLITVEHANGYRHAEVRRRRPYDLIVANILARPLCKLSPDLARHLAPGGTAILSGLLNSQESQVLSAHRLQGLTLRSRVRRNGWSTLVLRRRSGR